jgi:Sel1 repeat
MTKHLERRGEIPNVRLRCRWDLGFGIWGLGFVVLLLVAAFPSPAAAQRWDTNTLVNEAHKLEAADLTQVRDQANGGDARAQALLGLAYEMGSAGLEANAVEALGWFLKAADLGVPWAEMWAGDFYYTGSVGVPRDLYKALELYRSAADHGDPRAAFNVGRMYFFGEGVATNHEEAASWFRRALPADPATVGRMVALAEVACKTTFCVSFRQVLGAMTTSSADQFAGEWDEMTHEWDSVKTLSGFDRCGFTSSNKAADGDVQNYFCDSDMIVDATVGADTARQLADDVDQALGQGWNRSSGDGTRANAYFFTRDGYPRVRVTYNVTIGDAPQRVTLLVGP